MDGPPVGVTPYSGNEGSSTCIRPADTRTGNTADAPEALVMLERLSDSHLSHIHTRTCPGAPRAGA